MIAHRVVLSRRVAASCVSAAAAVAPSHTSSARHAASSSQSEEQSSSTTESSSSSASAKLGKKAGRWEQHDEWSSDNFDGGPDDGSPEYSEPEPPSYEDLIAAHRVLGTRPGDPLYRIKLSYMMRARETHPEVDGNPATFYKISLAYERIMRDRGIEMRDGRIVYSESVPKIPVGHDVLADVSRDVLIQAAEDVPGVDRYERAEALERMREVRMSLAGTSEFLTNPKSAAMSEMKSLEKLELQEGILLAPQALRGMAWHEQPFRMLTSEVRERDGEDAAKMLEAIVAPVQLRIGGAGTEEDGEGGSKKQLTAGGASGEEAEAEVAAEKGAGEKTKKAVVAGAAKEQDDAGKSKQVVEKAADTVAAAATGGAASAPAPAPVDALKSSAGGSSSSSSSKAVVTDDGSSSNKAMTPGEAVVAGEIVPELLQDAEKIAEFAEENKGTLKFQAPEATTHVTSYLGPGTQVVAARQFEALGRAGKMSTYMRYSNFPHPPRPLHQLPKDLDADHNLRPEEEEAVARSIIHKQMDEGKIHPQTVMNYLGKSTTVAGMAAQTATIWMESTEERKNLFVEMSFLMAATMALVMCGMATVVAWIRYNQVFSAQNKAKGVQQYINLDTMLPWWGNDASYEDNVKRIFLEEYRKGRQQAEQLKNYQSGLEQETRSVDEKRRQEVEIFDVSPEQVKAMRQRVVHRLSPEDA